MEGSELPGGQRTNIADHVRPEKINMLLNVIKTVSVSVEKSDTVRNVKAILKEKEGIPECVQSLSFSGECLRDCQMISDCGIQENSMVQVFVQDFVPLRLFIKPQSHHKIIVIEARPSDTIEDVKSSIMAKEGTHSRSFNLLYAGKQLPDDRTLESLAIKRDSTLHMVTNPKLTYTLSVKMPSGEILKVGVKLWYTVGDVRSAVASIVDSSVDHLLVVYNGEYLHHDSKSLYMHNITEESMLEMVPKSIQVSIQFLSGMTLTYGMNSDDLVINVKEKIRDDKEIPVEQVGLIFEGRQLYDDHTLGTCNIMNGSSLHGVLKLGRRRPFLSID